jgi:hypothetical protein
VESSCAEVAFAVMIFAKPGQKWVYKGRVT